MCEWIEAIDAFLGHLNQEPSNDMWDHGNPDIDFVTMFVFDIKCIVIFKQGIQIWQHNYILEMIYWYTTER